VQRIQRVTQPPGIAYVEVPDATRYAELVTAPFQDFNTEHINHFSLKCLNNLFQPAGWVVRVQGQKTILSSPDMPYPAAYAVYTKAPATTSAPVYDRDWELREKIQDYIQRSQDILNAIEANLKRALRETPKVIVWGTGQLAIRLLVETSLGRAHIKAFVDGNPINQGRVLRGVTILAPEQIQGMEEPIVIATILHQKEIVQVIREKMRLPNPVVLLRPG
jgi:hypothetical protein